MRAPDLRRRTITAILLVANTGCATRWQPVTLPPTAALDPKATLEVRIDSSWIPLHGVTFGQDSLTGIPKSSSLSCDSCRVTFALASITQARRPDPGQVAPVWRIVVPVVIGLGVVGSVINATTSHTSH